MALALTSFAMAIPASAVSAVHTVTFSENTSAGDEVTAFETGNSPQALTWIDALSPSFSNAGYLFKNWNTSADGTGQSFADGSNFSFTSDMSLFAQWIEIPLVHTVTFYENASTLDSVSTYLSGTSPAPLTSFTNLQPTFVNPGSNFVGWNTADNGSGVSYADGSQYAFSSDVSLYAQWTPITSIPLVHTVTFYENAYASDAASAKMSSGSSAALTLESSLQPKFVSTSQSFQNWNTSVDGSGLSYLDGATYSFKSDLVLYAQWKTVSVATISFSANGGDGSVASVAVALGSTFTMPTQTNLIRSGYLFKCWNTSATGSGTNYLAGQILTAIESITLYAQWTIHKQSELFGAIGTFKSGSSSLSPALKSQINRLALTIKSRKFLKIELYGYTGTTGLRSLNLSLSRARARNAAAYLRGRLNVIRVHGVTISSAGEGAIAGQSSNKYSRVEVFGV